MFGKLVWSLKTVQFVCLAAGYFIGTVLLTGAHMFSESRKSKRAKPQ